MRFVVVLVVLTIIAAGAWYLLSMTKPASPADSIGVAPAEVEKEKDIIVTKTDITTGGVSKLPVGFPKDVPVEVANITESYRAVYEERGVTQYTVSYTSQKSRDDLWTGLSDYMRGAGYAVDTSVSSKSGGQISGQRDEDTLSAVISSRNGISLVQLNLLDRAQ